MLTLPHRSKMPKAMIRRHLALLDDNITLGDLPLHVLATEWLYYTNWDEFVPDWQVGKLTLLRRGMEARSA